MKTNYKLGLSLLILLPLIEGLLDSHYHIFEDSHIFRWVLWVPILILFFVLSRKEIEADSKFQTQIMYGIICVSIIGGLFTENTLSSGFTAAKHIIEYGVGGPLTPPEAYKLKYPIMFSGLMLLTYCTSLYYLWQGVKGNKSICFRYFIIAMTAMTIVIIGNLIRYFS